MATGQGQLAIVLQKPAVGYCTAQSVDVCKALRTEVGGTGIEVSCSLRNSAVTRDVFPLLSLLSFFFLFFFVDI